MLFLTFFITTAILGSASPCPENEIYTDCVNPCNTCEQKGACNPPPTCQQGCDCKPGFYRDENGYCVQEQQCMTNLESTGCPRNALFLPCAPLSVPTCENPYPETEYEEECVPGCVCRQGFLKRKDGQCVSPNRCYQKEDREKENPSPKCPKNAIFIKCGSPCPPTCEDMQPEPCEEKCTTACYCKPGYLKRKDGVCVLPMDCHRTKKQSRPARKCPENAIYIKCGSPCPPTCEDRMPVCKQKCTKACYCKPGFLLKTDEAKCVKPENCNTSLIAGAVRCPENEELSECVVPCNDCKIKGNCMFFACNKGCDCKRGYFRNKDGKCIPSLECTEIMDPQSKCATDEQFYECTPSCKNKCENIYNPDAKCQCGPPGCFCKEGLVKREDGKCVPTEQCELTPQPECNADEQFYECTPSCRNTCENFTSPNARCYCGPSGCFCKEGLVKRSDGQCVPPNQCHENDGRYYGVRGRPKLSGTLASRNQETDLVSPQPECGENEKFYNCTPGCKNTCENFSNPAVRCGCGPPGCFCKDGLVKRADGKCIRPNQCHAMKRVSCPENAEFSVCGPYSRPTCRDPYSASFSGPCVKGCFCKSGFVEDVDGKCVRLRNCSKKCLHPGEEFRECGSTCPDTCENRGRPPPGSCPYRCSRGCFCKKGLYRTKSGHCVPLKDCDRDTTSQHHYFTATSKPIIKSENTDVPDDCHGCPDREECEAYCKTLGDFIGLCIGKSHLHCRCA